MFKIIEKIKLFSSDRGPRTNIEAEKQQKKFTQTNFPRKVDEREGKVLIFVVFSFLHR